MRRPVTLEREVLESLSLLPPASKRALKAALKSLETDPSPGAHEGRMKRMDASRSGNPVFRLKVGDYRIVFVVTATEIRVVRAFHRSEGYDWMKRLGFD